MNAARTNGEGYSARLGGQGPGGEETLTNDATLIVMMREGTRTVLRSETTQGERGVRIPLPDYGGKNAELML